jgi:hypothetical protein
VFCNTPFGVLGEGKEVAFNINKGIDDRSCMAHATHFNRHFRSQLCRESVDNFQRVTEPGEPTRSKSAKRKRKGNIVRRQVNTAEV